MQYPKYFKNGQKILLRSLGADPGYFEVLTVYYQDHGPGYFDVALPYRPQEGEEYPFTPGMSFELVSDALGMGLRISGALKEYFHDRQVLRITLTSDLQIFKRRIHRRLDTNIGLRYTRGQGTLRSFREQWQKNLAILENSDPAKLPAFPSSRVNLSPGGIRFAVKPPVNLADLCLLLFQLEIGKKPICAVAEVVWMADQEVEGRRTVGMQFTNILESHRKELEHFVEERLRFLDGDTKKK